MSRRSSRAAAFAATEAFSSSTSSRPQNSVSASSSSSHGEKQQMNRPEDNDRVVVEDGLFRRVPKGKQKRLCDLYSFGEVTDKKSDAF